MVIQGMFQETIKWGQTVECFQFPLTSVADYLEEHEVGGIIKILQAGAHPAILFVEEGIMIHSTAGGLPPVLLLVDIPSLQKTVAPGKHDLSRRCEFAGSDEQLVRKYLGQDQASTSRCSASKFSTFSAL